MGLYEIMRKYEAHFNTSIAMPLLATEKQLDKFGKDLMKCIEENKEYQPNGVGNVLI